MNVETKSENEKEESVASTSLKKTEEHLGISKKTRDFIILLILLQIILTFVLFLEVNKCVQRWYWISISIFMSGIFASSLENFPFHKMHAMLMIFIGTYTLVKINSEKYNNLLIMISLLFSIFHITNIFWNRICKMSWKVALCFIIIYFLSSLLFSMYSYFNPSEKIDAMSLVIEVLSQVVLLISYDLLLLYIAMNSRTSMIE